MSEQLIFGKKGQVHFKNARERDEAVSYILSELGRNVQMAHEDNQNQGAWGPEERIHFRSGDGVPQCLKDLMTAGNGSLYGRINCKEFVRYIQNRR